MDIPLAYGLYMAESEGFIPTHEGKVNAMLKDIKEKRKCGITQMDLDQSYVSQFGLNIEDLTLYDVRRCEKALIG